MIEKNVTTFGHLFFQNTLGRTTLNLKTFEKIEDTYAIALPILYRNQITFMATKIQRKHPQAPAINYTLRAVLENVMETGKESNQKLASLLLRDKRQDKTWPPSHLTYSHNANYVGKFLESHG